MRQLQLAVQRSIPACAGEPPVLVNEAQVAEVYPRVCGGTTYGFRYPAGESGLSPRVRGNPPHGTGKCGCPGSIPACAGEPAGCPAPGSGARVYPRVCGGTNRRPSRHHPRQGLSPRVRGNPLCRDASPHKHRSIPACAGEPRPARLSGTAGEVYPRVCGGTQRVSERYHPGGGLSPRVRGNPQTQPAAMPRYRSIPACAGEPAPLAAGVWRREVYPRVCGGTAVNLAINLTPQGLSPRVRGNPPPSYSSRPCRRSIPACAGEPPPCRTPAGNTRVYPRVCGGTPPSHPHRASP